MTRAEAMIHRLVRGIQTSARTLIVTAHPDDETVSLGGSLGLMRDAMVLQLTTGSDRDDAYAVTRQQERALAWVLAGWTLPVRDCGIADQQVYAHLSDLVAEVDSALEGCKVVMTHPYEGGHPDHDAAAFIVQAACDRRQARGQWVPERVEFASYHHNGSRRVAGDFWRDTQHPTWTAKLTGPRVQQKTAAMGAYQSQANVVRWFSPVLDRYRLAPRYDFSKPPTPPVCLYERKQWPLTNAALRAAFAAVAA